MRTGHDGQVMLSEETKWSKFLFLEKENTGFVVNKDQRFGEFILAAQFLTPMVSKYGGHGKNFQTVVAFHEWFQDLQP